MSRAPVCALWEAMSPEARRAAVVPLIARGFTASGIAANLGATRNAVIGFCRRQGLTLPGNKFFAGLVDLSRPKNERSAAGGHATRKKAGVTLAGPRGPAAVGSRPLAVGGAAVVAAVAVEPLAVVEVEPPAPAGGVGFLALTGLHCRRPLWPNGAPPPLSGMFFCGARAVAGTSYCRACTPRLTAPTPGLIRRRAEAERETRAAGAGPLPSSPARGEGDLRGAP